MISRFRTLLVAAGALAAVSVSSKAFALSLTEISPTPKTYAFGTDFGFFADNIFGTGPSPLTEGPATGFLQAVSNLGCSSSDYGAFAAGSIALVFRGSCTFAVKAEQAISAGAAGLIIYNNVPGTAINGSISILSGPMPTVFATNELGLHFLDELRTGQVRVNMNVSSVPLPASLPLIASAIGAMVFGTRRKKRKP